MKIVTEHTMASLSDAERFVLFVCVFNRTGHSVTDLRRLYIECTPHRLSVDETVRSCKGLERLGLIACRYKYSTPAYNVYDICGKFNYAALRDLLASSVAGGWWKAFEVNSNSGLPLSGSRGYFSHGGTTLSYSRDSATIMRAMIDSAGLQVDLSEYYDVCDKYRDAALDLAQIIDSNCAWPWPTKPFGKTNPLLMHLTLLSILFVRGSDIRASLTAIAADMVNDRVRFSDCGLCEIVALALLTGTKFDWKVTASWDNSEEVKAVTQVEALLRGGDLATANKILMAAYKAISRLSSVAAPAFNILAMLVSGFHKPTTSRILNHIRALCPSVTYRQNYRGSGEQGIVNDRNKRFKSFVDLQNSSMIGSREHVAGDFLDSLALVIGSLAFGMKKDVAAAIAPAMCESAKDALEYGYPTVAGAILSSFSWAMPADKRPEISALVAKVSEANGIWFKAADAASSEWKRIISALDERLPKKTAVKEKTTAKVHTGRIVWSLAVLPSVSGNDYLVCEAVGARFRGPRAADDGSDDRSITLKSVYGGKYDDCLTEADRTVVAALNKISYAGPKYRVTIPAAVLEALCGQDNVMTYDDSSYSKDSKPVASTLTRQDIPVVGKESDNGAMLLSVPEWCLDAGSAYAIRKTDTKHHFLFYSLTRDMRAVLDVFRDYGDVGEITLPKEALAAARPLLGRLAAVLPLQGALSGLGGTDGGDGMKRVKGNATPLVRLALEEMRLHLSLRVRPMETAASVVFEPGVGQSERTLKLAKAPVILIRNLELEKSGAATVETALSEFESWRDGCFDWQIDEPVDALGALAAIHALGAAVQVEWLPGKRLSVSRPAAAPSVEASLGADQWFAVSGEWKLDDGRLVSFAKVLENFDRRIGVYVPIDDKGYLALSRALLRQLEALKSAGQIRKDSLVVSPAAMPMLDGAFTMEDGGMKLPKAMDEYADRIREAFAAEPETPRTFKGTMRPYQEDGYRWLSRLCDCGIGACLADDMGLGKTIQLIALLAAKKSSGPSLVIAPASVAFNWRNELERFAPSLKVALVGQVAGAGDEDVAAIAKTNDVVVTSYGVAASRNEAFESVGWNILILDEAQAIKNHLTQRAKAVKTLKARFQVAATGTPVENRLTELWSIFDFLNPGMLGGETWFNRELAPHGAATPRLKRLVKPLILRRIKRDVLSDLPEKEEITIPVILGEDERHAYEATRRAAVAKLEDSDPENKIAILAELTRLRRFCCHPSLVMPDVEFGAKLEALSRLLASLRENGHRALVFSQFVDFLSIVRKQLEANGWTYEYLDGSTSKAERESSVARFQSGEGDFFLISLKAGGMGLNLTAANYVILLDPWWNPAVENQAADRVHRIGQRLPVTVYRLIAQDTIEEKVVRLHAQKTALAEDILASGAAAMTADEMMGLLKGD